jgi:uncharacterized damage-inducible protein DinB
MLNEQPHPQERSMMTAQDRVAGVERLRRLPDLLEAAVRGLSDPQLDTPYRVGGWTVRQVVHHLADSHMNAFVRCKLILTEEHPTLKPYDQDRWALLVDAQRLPIASSLAIVRGLHERWCRLLDSLSDAHWVRAGQHPERGEVTLDSLLATYAGHGEKHVGQITGLRRERGW